MDFEDACEKSGGKLVRSSPATVCMMGTMTLTLKEKDSEHATFLFEDNAHAVEMKISKVR
jgi:hypothetical protein